MRNFVHFSFFGIVLVATVVSLAQNPPGSPAPPANDFPPPQANPEMDQPPQMDSVPPVSGNASAPQQHGNQQLPQVGNPAPARNSVGPQVQKPTSVQQPANAGNEPQVPDSDMPVFQNPEGYHYDPTGRRDPFKPYGESQTTMAPETGPETPATPPEPLQGFDVSQFRLLGIIWQVKDPKAMVLDPTGRTHLIRKQTKIGRNNGFVAAIREGEVIVVEPSVGENGVQTAVTRILNLK